MKKIFQLIIGVAWFSNVIANNPDTITLNRCLEMASARSPLVGQKAVSEDLMNYRITNLKTNWYPSVGLNAHAIYNSETVEFSDLLQNLPGEIPSLPLDQYKVWAEINQQIYDGGMIKALKEIEKAGYKSEIYQTEAELHALRSEVSRVFFSLLLTQNNSEIISSAVSLLGVRKNIIRAGVTNGVILQEDLLAIEAEEIGLQQKLTELKLMKKQLYKILSILTDSVISENSFIQLPVIPQTDNDGIRPEFQVFEQQKEKLKLNIKLVKSADMPKLFAFTQIAYGRPGYNMVSREFHTFYTIGAGMKWNFLNYGDTKRQFRIIESQQELIDIKRQNFDDQLKLQLETQASNIEKYDSLIKQDIKILELRKSIAEVSLSKLNNGVITSADYLEDMNAELLTRLQLESHTILKKQAEFNFLNIQGKLKY